MELRRLCHLGKLWIFLFVVLVLLALLPAHENQVRAGASSLPPINTVFIILEENTNWSNITASVAPYIHNTLLPLGAHAEQYFNPPNNHPSEPNYIWLEAGDNLGLTTDDDPSPTNSTSTTSHLVTLLKNAGISWKGYMEDIDGTTCPLSSSGNYAAKHDPFVFFQDTTGNNNASDAYCLAHVRPYSELAGDLSTGSVARYNFITPNLCDDMHDCSITHGDTWLSTEVPKILDSQAYKGGGVLLITWDEGIGGDGPIGMICLSPFAKVNYSNSIHYTHSSTVRTIEEIFNVTPLLRDAANATDLGDFFQSSAPPGTPSFSMAAQAGSSTSATVAAGATANYSLSIVPSNGFTGMVALSCTGAPANADCAASPGSINVNSAAANFSVMVTTKARTGAIPAAFLDRLSARPVGRLLFAAFVLLLPALAAIALSRRGQRGARVFGLVFVLIVVAAALGCSSADGSGGGPPSSTGTLAGNYTLTVSGVSGALSNSISLQLRVQ